MEFHSPYYGERTQLVLQSTSPRNKTFALQTARERLGSLARESSLVLRLQDCFPEVDPEYPDRPLRHSCPHPETIAPDTDDEAEKLVLQTIKNQGKYLRRLSNVRNIPKSNKMMDWLSGRSDIQQSQSYYKNDINASRELMYAFCGILGYQYQEISDFFWKVTFQPPFKHKVWTEVIYSYFSSQAFPEDQPKQNWYTAARELIQVLKPEMQEDLPVGSPKIENTREIENAVWNISSEKTLQAYLLANRASFRESNFNLTARESIQTLYRDCMEYARVAYDAAVDDGYVAHDTDGVEETFSTALLFSAMLGKTTAKNGLPHHWPEAIRKNFPSADLLGRVLRNEEKISDSVLRKLLLLLEFYSFYAALRHEKCIIHRADRYDVVAGFNRYRDAVLDYSGFFEKFLDDADWQLFQCGFGGLYPRNPYDCLFLLAASSAHPLEALPSLLENGPAVLGQDETSM